MERKTRARGAAVLFALGSLLGALVVFAGPAHAGDSGTAVADDTSTASGGCVAVNGSVCSGSGLAANGSTSSGGACAPEKHAAPPEREHRRPGHRPEKQGGEVSEAVSEAPTATPTGAVELAFTGSSTGPLAAAGAGALALGLVLVALASERRRPVHSS
jgi:hypothetical protein